MTATLRYRGKSNDLIELAKNLDAFKKVPEKYTETTEIGGTVSLLSRLLIVYLIYKEIRYYQEANLVFQYRPDIDMDGKVPMHIDITVATPCNSLASVDVQDETMEEMYAFRKLQHENTYWLLPLDKRQEFERMQAMNVFLREEYHSVADILFRDIINNQNEKHFEPIPKTVHNKLNEKYDACRIYGTVEIRKVSGKVHLVGGGRPIVNLFDDNFMIRFERLPANYSHRINRLSFGQYSRHIVQPLEGDEVFVHDEETAAQYFLNIVPTEIHKTFSTINTYQYSVTENIRKMDVDQTTFGRNGIYFKYDWSALKIIVRTDRDNVVQFVIRLCSIISGIIVTTGILNYLLVAIQRCFLHTFAPQLLHAVKQHNANNINHDSFNNEHDSTTSTTLQTFPAANNLISTANKMSDIVINTDNPIMTATPIVPNIPEHQKQNVKFL